MTFDDVRKIALAWPGVEDGTSYGTPALKVRKKLLARLREDHDSLVMFGVPSDERDMLIESQPKIFYFTDHYRDYPMVLIRLSKAKRAIVEPLLRRRWRELASKSAVKAFDMNAVAAPSRLCAEQTSIAIQLITVDMMLPLRPPYAMP